MSAPSGHRHRREHRRDYRRLTKVSVDKKENPLAELKRYLKKEFTRAKRVYKKALEEYRRKIEEYDEQEDEEMPSEPKLPNVRFSLFDLMNFTKSESYGEAMSLLESIIHDERFAKKYKITQDAISGSYIMRKKDSDEKEQL